MGVRNCAYADAVKDASKNLNYGQGREALLQAAVRVVADKGLRGMTFRAVADEAGVNNTLIAHHFGSRDKMLAAALEWSVDRSIAGADLSEYGSDAAAFRTALIDNVLSEPDSAAFQYEMILEARRRPELQPTVRELYRKYVAKLAAGRLRDGEPASDGLNLALFAALDGLMLQYVSGAITADQVADAIDSLAKAVNGAVVAD
ncbi:MAG: TetR family transcriptional regulator [Mycobacterium sp.]|jgi:AcrR family transcriptional regulator|nr:TetR family transcriptional regulator [Mycobacterium sp.]